MRWWHYAVAAVLTAILALFVMDLWSPNGLIEEYRTNRLLDAMQQSAAQESDRLAEEQPARDRERAREAAAEARRIKREQEAPGSSAR